MKSAGVRAHSDAGGCAAGDAILQGALSIYVPAPNLARIYGRPLEECETLVRDLQALGRPIAWGGWLGVALTTVDQAKEFVHRLRHFIAGSAPISATLVSRESSD